MCGRAKLSHGGGTGGTTQHCCSLLASPAIAQINGTPSSVTSTNFGGHVNSTPGVPASVTSLGPNGVQPRSQFFTQPGCCVNPLVPGTRTRHFFKGDIAISNARFSRRAVRFMFRTRYQ